MKNFIYMLGYIYWNIVLFITNLLENIVKLISFHTLILFYILLVLKLINMLDIDWLFVCLPLLIHIILLSLDRTSKMKQAILFDNENEEDEDMEDEI